MKSNHLILTAAALLVSLCAVSCNKEKEQEADPVVKLDKTSIEAENGEQSFTVSLTSTLDWSLKDYTSEVSAWLSVDPSSGKASTQLQTITISLTANKGEDRTAEITFYGNKAYNATLKVIQKGNPEAGIITVKEFLEKKDTQTEYQLRGVTGKISRGTSYYGFYIKDNTGELSCPFPANWTEYSAAIHTGDSVTIKGKYAYYEAKSQDQMSDCNILKHVSGTSSVTDVTVKEFLDKADSYAIYRLKGTVASTVDATYCSFTLKDDTGSVKVYSVNNASEWGSKVKQNGTVTLKGAYQLYTSGTTSTHEVVDADIEDFTEGGGGGGKIEGANLLTNGGFENWTDGKPDAWMQVSSNATVAQSSEARTGSSSASVTGASSANKRIMSKIYTLKPGTYQIEVFTKGEGVFRYGYAVTTEGSVASSDDYVYLNSATDAGADWTDSYAQFTLDSKTTVSIVVMNSKNGAGKAFLLDDVSLVTKDGGLDDPEDPEDPKEIPFEKLDPAAVKVGTYVLSYENGGKSYIMKNEVVSSYYVKAEEYDLTTGTVPGEDFLFEISQTEGGYLIKNSKGGYVGVQISGTHYNLKPSLESPYVWTFSGDSSSVTAKGADSGDYYLSYNSKYTEFTMSNKSGYCPVYYKVK